VLAFCVYDCSLSGSCRCARDCIPFWLLIVKLKTSARDCIYFACGGAHYWTILFWRSELGGYSLWVLPTWLLIFHCGPWVCACAWLHPFARSGTQTLWGVRGKCCCLSSMLLISSPYFYFLFFLFVFIFLFYFLFLLRDSLILL